MSAYYQVCFSLPAHLASQQADHYLSLGALSASLSQDESGNTLLTVLANSVPWFKSVGIQEKPQRLKKSDWEYTYENSLSILELIPGVAIHAFHAQPKPIPASSTLTLTLDFRGAFGDGAHPTTKLCAQFLKDLSPQATSVIDIGTGSGILALLASQLGITTIHGFDHDAVSVKRAKRNAKLNKIKAHFWEGSVYDLVPAQGYDLVIANLLSDVIEKSLPQLKQWLNPGGALIVSGISTQWQAQLTQSFDHQGITIQACKVLDGWCGFVLKK